MVFNSHFPSFQDHRGRDQDSHAHQANTHDDDDSFSVSSLASSRNARGHGHVRDGLPQESRNYSAGDETPGKDQSRESISEKAESTSLKTWTPLSLRRIVLLGYAILFILIIVALEVLNYVSNRDQGLATVAENLYYLWKFGPTFILTIIIAFWAHVEYSAKQVMPWMMLAKSGDASSRGFTLNYLTAAVPEALFHSGKARHLPVFFGITGTLLLRLLVVFSTGLLTAENQLMTRNETVLVLDQFNFTKNYGGAVPADILRTLWATSQLNLSYPSATTPDFSTQSFFTSNSSHRTTTAFEVEVFEASLDDCVSFNADLPEEVESLDRVADVLPDDINDFLSPYCVFGYPALSMKTLAGGWLPDLSMPRIIDICMNSTDYDPNKNSHRLMLFLTFPNPDGTSLLSGSICHPNYSLRRRAVSVTASGSTQSLELSGDAGKELQIEIPPKNLTENFIEQTNTGFARYQTDNSTSDLPAWVIPLNWSMPQSNLSDFRDANLSTKAFQQFYRSDLAQLARSHYVSPTNQSISGLLTSSYKRLRVGQWSLRIMEALLALLTLTSICLCCFTYPRFRRNPESLAAHAMLLAKSPDLWPVLQGSGKSLRKPFHRSLLNFKFQAGETRDSRNGPIYTHINASETPGIIEHVDSEAVDAEHSSDPNESSKKPRWWRPIVSTWPYRISTIVVTISVIIVLEVLYQVSAKNKGLATISSQSYQLYGWLYVSTLIMAGTALAYGALDSTARLLHPFQGLRRGKMRFQELYYEPLGQAAILATFHSLRKRYFALTVILLTSLLSPALTIVTSGLFTISTMSYHASVPLEMQDWIVAQDRKINDCNRKSRLVSDALSFNNLSYPQWTYDDLVFPKVSLGSLKQNSTFGSATSITARLPSIRHKMNCRLQGFHDSTNFSMRYLDEDPQKSVEVQVDPPEGCYHYDKNSTQKRVRLVDVDINNNGTGYHGGLEASWDWQGTCERHVYVIVARLDDRRITEGTVLDCVPYAEAVYVSVNLTLPDLSVDTSVSPPRPDEGGRKERFTNFTSNEVDTCQGQEAPTLYDGNISVDPFFAAVVLGAGGGVPVPDLLGPRNVDRLVARSQAVYAQIMAQNYNFDLRRPLATTPNISDAFAYDMLRGSGGGGGDGPVIMNGTITTTEERLVQSAIATRILEAVLAAMAVCAALHFAFAQETRILPKDPGSVAAKMSLFAGSEVVRRLAAAADGRDGDDYAKRAFDGEVVRLGWWDDDGGSSGASERAATAGQKRFGVDVGAAEKSG